MHLVGDGVTRNFLTILENDLRRAAKSLLGILAVAGLVFLLAWLTLNALPLLGLLAVPLAFTITFAGGNAYARHFVIDSYEVSLRDHWNRWMRWSVSCRTVRECYAKVHNRSPGPSWWAGGLLLTGLVLVHAILGVIALNAATQPMDALPLFLLDAGLLGYLLGRRMAERTWYRRFLRSCNELLRDGQLGLWGVY